MNRALHKICIGIALTSLIGCASIMPKETARRLAHAAWMVEREIPAAPFALTAYERMHERHTTANLYIGGDAEKRAPANPVALHMATKDNAKNVVYLARPCDYSGMLDGSECGEEYRTDRRFAPEVIRAYDAALTNISRKYNITGFHLIGYDGGAVIATELAKRRKDILSLRTVAGQLGQIVNPQALAGLPQHHFIGGQDEMVSPAQLHSYLQASQSGCVNHSFVQENEHEKGWAEKWPELLAKDVTCRHSYKSLDLPAFEPYDRGFYTTRESGKGQK